MDKNNNLIYKLHDFLKIKEDLIKIVLYPDAKPMQYQAGQYLEILYPDGNFQPFSIANAPDPNARIELHIRCLKNDFATTSMLENLQQKKSVTLRGPFGNAYYREQPANPVILLAGGTGFAYVKAIIEKAIQVNDQRQFHLYWGVKTVEDFYLADLPLHWKNKLKNFNYIPVISQGQNNPAWSGEVGYVYTIAVKDHPDFSNLQVYASGPMAMIQTAFNVFQRQGLKRENMHSDMLVEDAK